MSGNHPSSRWPLKAFRVVDDSMRPALAPGDGVIALRRGTPEQGQVRVFRDPTNSARWLVKRVGEVYVGSVSTTFEARSDNPDAPGAADSHVFGWVPAADSYRVVWTAHRRPPRRRVGR